MSIIIWNDANIEPMWSNLIEFKICYNNCTNNILKRREHIYSGASIYKLQTYQDEIKDRIADGQNLVFVNPKNDIAFSDSILTYYHLFDYAGKTFEIDGHIIDEQTKVFAKY